MDKNTIGALAFAVIGVCLLAPGLFILATTAMEYLKMDAAEGTVIEIRVRSAVKTGGAQMSSPIIRYVSKDGAEHVARAARSYSRSPFQEGDRVPLRYDPATPDTVMIDSVFEVWGLGLLLSAFGAAFVFAGILAFQRLK